VDGDSQPFWDACAREQLVVQRCRACATSRFPPSPICPECLSAEHDWLAAAGAGTVYSFVIVREALNPAFKDEVPYVVAIIELAEGPHMLSNVVGVPVERVRIGMPVRVSFERLSDDVVVPKFRPADIK